MYRILVSDKCLLFRDAVSVLITKHNENNIVIESDSLEHAIKLADHHENFDIALITVMDPNTSNQLVDVFRKRFNDCKIIAVFQDENFSQEYIQSLNVDGVLSIKSSHHQFMSAIKTVICGEKYICPTLIEKKTTTRGSNHNSKRLGNISKQQLLTQRQTEVLKYISSGHSNKLIAYELGISEGTIKLHVSSILRTLKVTNRTMAAMYAKQHSDLLPTWYMAHNANNI